MTEFCARPLHLRLDWKTLTAGIFLIDRGESASEQAQISYSVIHICIYIYVYREGETFI